ncbi:MAG TPA: DUF5961 family protein [Brevundimonas sp.]
MGQALRRQDVWDEIPEAAEITPAPTRPAPERRFAVHAADDGRHRWETVWAVSHDDAAIGFVERHHPTVGDDGEVTVVVTDCESGHEHCFRIDLDTGDTAPCA